MILAHRRETKIQVKTIIMKSYVAPKLIGLAILVMITLVIISFAEVAVYSYVVNPGHDASFYEAHANVSAPYISGIFGFVIFFLVSRHWKKKGLDNAFRLSIYFPLTYVLLDVVVLILAGMTQWSGFILIFLLANAAKFLGSYLGYLFTRTAPVKTARG